MVLSVGDVEHENIIESCDDKLMMIPGSVYTQHWHHMSGVKHYLADDRNL